MTLYEALREVAELAHFRTEQQRHLVLAAIDGAKEDIDRIEAGPYFDPALAAGVGELVAEFRWAKPSESASTARPAKKTAAAKKAAPRT